MGDDYSGTQLLVELIKQVQADMNNRFDKLEDRNQAIVDRVSEIDRTYVHREEFQDSLRQLVKEFTRLTDKMEVVITVNALQEEKWVNHEKRIAVLESDKSKKIDNRALRGINLKTGIIAGVISSMVLVLGELILYFIK